MRPRLLTILTLTLCAVVLAVAACSGDQPNASESVTVTHAAVTPVATITGAADGVGTVRLFHAEATFEGIGPGSFDATMTTTWVDAAAGAETRITKIVFVLDGSNDQLIIEGSSIYPTAGSTIALAATVTRPVIGGSGTWSGARGTAETTHLADGSWEHVFTLVP